MGIVGREDPTGPVKVYESKILYTVKVYNKNERKRRKTGLKGLTLKNRIRHLEKYIKKVLTYSKSEDTYRKM